MGLGVACFALRNGLICKNGINQSSCEDGSNQLNVHYSV
jgi:hypothetical protein